MSHVLCLMSLSGITSSLIRCCIIQYLIIQGEKREVMLCLCFVSFMSETTSELLDPFLLFFSLFFLLLFTFFFKFLNFSFLGITCKYHTYLP